MVYLEPRGKSSLKKALIVDFLLEPHTNSLTSFFYERELESQEKANSKKSKFIKKVNERRTSRFVFFKIACLKIKTLTIRKDKHSIFIFWVFKSFLTVLAQILRFHFFPSIKKKDANYIIHIFGYLSDN